MGMFVVLFSVAVAVIQATSMLLDRPAHRWTFSILDTHSNTTDLQALISAPPGFFYGDLYNNHHHYGLSSTNNNNNSNGNNNSNNNNNNGSIVNLTYMSQNSSISRLQSYLNNGAPEEIRLQAACIQGAWRHLIPSSEIIHYCTFNRHISQTISPILEPVNPHLILLTICCIHSIFCISRTHIEHQDRVDSGQNAARATMIIPLGYAMFIYAALIVIVTIVEGLKDVNLVKYPTIVIVALLLGFCTLYVIRFSTHSKDIVWGVATHLQLVAVPLAILAISAMGVRLWSDILGHIELLNATVYCMWLQCNVQNVASRRICHALTFFLPLITLYIAHIQWGQYDDWRYVIGTMACGGLAPFQLFTFLFHVTSQKGSDADKRSTEKLFNQVSIMCSGAAILSLVVNLAIF